MQARVWKAAWSGLLGMDLTAELCRIIAPTLLVWGDRDEMAPRAEQEILLHTIPNARLVVFEGAGYGPHERPDRVRCACRSGCGCYPGRHGLALITIMAICALLALASFGLVVERRRSSPAPKL